MKKIIAILVALFCISGIYAQKFEVQNAISYQKSGKLDKAKESIDKACEHHKSNALAKTWFYKGVIYMSIGDSQIEAFMNLSEDPYNESFTAFKKAQELDEKGSYEGEIAQNFAYLAQQYYNKGAQLYNAEDFTGSAQSFKAAFDINKELGKVDTTAMLNYAITCNLAENYDEAQAKYEELLSWGYNDASIYKSLSEIYAKKGDSEKSSEIVAVGREMFPDDYALLLAEVNIFMSTGETQKAITSLTKATEHDPTNFTIWRALGDMYDKIVRDTLSTPEESNEAFGMAKESYLKAIEIQADYFDAYYNLGALYVNKAAEIQQVANELPLNEVDEYNAMKAEADGLLGEAMPYLEKALEINATDKNTILSLKEIYTRLGDLDKAKEMNLLLQ